MDQDQKNFMDRYMAAYSRLADAQAKGEDVNKVFCKLYIYSNENSKSKDTGAITVDGGVGIKKDLYVGGKIISKNMNITKKLSLSCNLTAKNTNLSLGEPDARFKGYFNEINSNVINNNSKINTSHLVVKNKLEICNNGNICFNVDKQNISIYGDSYIINAPITIPRITRAGARVACASGSI